MAVVWRNTFDGPVGTNLTPTNSANYGDPIVDNERNGNPADAVRYGDRAYIGNSSMQLGLQDGSGHGDTWVYYPTINAYSLSFYLYLTEGGWFRFRDANNLSELYLATDSDSYLVDQLFTQESELFDRWVRIEFIVSSTELGIRIWWSDPNSTGTPDYEYIVARDGGTVGGLLCQGGAGANVYVDQVRIGEGEWLGPWPEYADVSAVGEVDVTADAVPSKGGSVSAIAAIEADGQADHAKTTTVEATDELTVSGEAVGDSSGEGGTSALAGVDVTATAEPTKHSQTSAVATPEVVGLAGGSRSTQVGADAQVGSEGQAEAHKTGTPSAVTGAGVDRFAGTTKHGVSSAEADARVSVLAGTDPDEFLSLPVRVRVEIFVPGNSWVDITGDVRVTENIVITRGRQDEATEADASSMTLLLNNMHGRYSPRNPNSPYFGLIGRNTPIRVIVDQGDLEMPRFIGEVSEWPPRWDTSDTDVWINLEASGILRRLEQTGEAFSSALERFVMSESPIAYWPLTDGYESRLVGSPAVGTANFGFFVRLGQIGGLAYTHPAWQSASTPPHMEDLVEPRGARGQAQGSVSAGPSDEWAVDMVRIGIGGMDSFQVICSDGDTTQTWFLGEDPTQSPRQMFLSVQTETETSLGPPIEQANTTNQALFDDQPHHVRLHCVQVGSNTQWTVYVDGSSFMSGTFGGPLLQLRTVRYEWWVPEEDDFTQFIGLGHITVWGSNAPTPQDMWQAMLGWPNELAGLRIARLCVEQGVPLEVNGNLNDTQRVGPQQIEPFLTLLRQAAAVDGGLIHESRTQNAILYRTNRSRYNQDTIFTSEE